MKRSGCSLKEIEEIKEHASHMFGHILIQAECPAENSFVQEIAFRRKHACQRQLRPQLQRKGC
jgi:hypothetical protein